MEFEIISAIIDRITESLSECERAHLREELQGLKMQEKLEVAKSYMIRPEEYSRMVIELYRDYIEAMETVTNAQIDAVINCGGLKIAHGYFADIIPSV